MFILYIKKKCFIEGLLQVLTIEGIGACSKRISGFIKTENKNTNILYHLIIPIQK